ncbi:MAG: VTT domain-containing protein, partial [Polyangiales bacterium]
MNPRSDSSVEPRRRRWRSVFKSVLGIAVVAGLAALWTWGPLRDFASPERIVEITKPFQELWWTRPAAVAIFAVGALLLTPMTLLMAILVVLFGPWQAFAVSWLGALVSAVLGHSVGRFFWRRTLGRHVRRRWTSVTEALTENEFRSTII